MTESVVVLENCKGESQLSASIGPMFSVVTASFRARKLLPQLYASLLAQTCQDFEWVVIDGGSADGTVELLQRWTEDGMYDRLIWQSAPDRGIYDAMNQGIARCRGQYVLFMGADDELADTQVLADVREELLACPAGQRPDAVLGIVEMTGTRICYPRTDWHLRVRNSVPHQGAFYASRLFAGFRYDIRYRITADYELNLLLHLRQANLLMVPRLVSRCGAEGVSNRTRQSLMYLEMRRIRSRYIGPLRNWAYWAIGVINLLRRQLGV